jgi:hypothetical protein
MKHQESWLVGQPPGCQAGDAPALQSVPTLGRSVRGLFSNAKECFERASAQGFPNFDHFISDRRGKAHSQPNADCFDRQTGPRTDVQPDQNIPAVFPPTIGQSERYFPKQAEEEKQKKREAKGTPVDEWSRRVKEASRWNQGGADEINKIPREPVVRPGQKFSVQNRGCDQGNAKSDGSEMKTDDARYAFGCGRVVGDIVGAHPIFIAPNVTQQHEHEAGEIEDEFLDWNRSTRRGYLAAERSCFIWKNEESVAKEQIEQETDWREHCDGSPECFSRKLQIGPAGKPPPERRNRNNEQEQAPCISERGRIIRSGLQNDRVNDSAQCNRSRNNERRGNGEHDIESSPLSHAPKA